jgi:hypothetical protein
MFAFEISPDIDAIYYILTFFLFSYYIYMAGLAQLFGQVASSGLGSAVRAGVQAGRTAQNVRGAIEGVDDAKQLLETALNEDEYLRSGTTKDYIKKLNSDVVDFVENIPVIGEPLSILSTPLKMAYEGFVDDVLAPIFFDTEAEEKALERRRDWTQFIAERSLAKYGYVMTPDEWRAAEFEQLKERTAQKNEQTVKGMEEFEQKAKEAGFDNTAEYSDFARKQRQREIGEDVQELGFKNNREYIDARREETKRIREQRRQANRGVIPRSAAGVPVPTPEPITYENPRISPFVAPIRPMVPSRPAAPLPNPFANIPQLQQQLLSGIIQGLTPSQFSGVRTQ